jgi:uncharacterized protein
MLFLLSPAKSLDYQTPAGDIPHSEPAFVRQSAQLIRLLKAQSPREIAALMDLSDALAGLNVARYQAWRSKSTADNAKQAVLAFNGDVYEGLDAKSLQPADLDWAQGRLCILSGLYGVLKPLDRIQPYRLEMGTALANEAGANLYSFWGGRLAKHFNERLKTDPTPVVVNLASQEYAKAVDRKTLKAQVVDCVFEELRNGQYKIISFMAKRARGLMVRYAVQHRIDTPDQLAGFDVEGYAIDAQSSRPDRLVFRRASPAAL